jgi:amidohydrolase
MLPPMTPWERIDQAIDERRTELVELARLIHRTPELAFAERRSSAAIIQRLEQHGASVERALGGLDTAFRARVPNGAGPHVALLAEYDALPEIGHACGHNLIAAAAVGAWWALAAVGPAWTGTVDLMGTPAEEGGGGKVKLLAAGVFDGLDAALMFHPFDRDLTQHPTLANCRLEFAFSGRCSHAAIAPWDGASALTACLDTFRLIDSQRQHFREGVRVHGIVREGGQATNIIPERAVAEFTVRARDAHELGRVREIVERCALGASTASAVELGIAELQDYREMRLNRPLGRCFARHLADLGREAQDTDPSAGTGSTDAGNLSYYLPVLHPWLAICDPGEAACHQQSFAQAAVSSRGFDTMLVAAKALARTAFEVLTRPELRTEVWAAFEARQS